MIDLRVPDEFGVTFGVTHVTGLEPNAIAGHAQRLEGRSLVRGTAGRPSVAHSDG
jgi:hypothetical protein